MLLLCTVPHSHHQHHLQQAHTAPVLAPAGTYSQNTQDAGPIVTLETVAALLDGATPLHCAALRGNPSQVR
jgi:hypothetical protein